MKVRVVYKPMVKFSPEDFSNVESIEFGETFFSMFFNNVKKSVRINKDTIWQIKENIE